MGFWARQYARGAGAGSLIALGRSPVVATRDDGDARVGAIGSLMLRCSVYGDGLGWRRAKFGGARGFVGALARSMSSPLNFE